MSKVSRDEKKQIITNIQKLEPKDGDIIVLQSSYNDIDIPDDVINSLNYFLNANNINIPILVIGADAGIEVVTQANLESFGYYKKTDAINFNSESLDNQFK